MKLVSVHFDYIVSLDKSLTGVAWEQVGWRFYLNGTVTGLEVNNRGLFKCSKLFSSLHGVYRDKTFWELGNEKKDADWFMVNDVLRQEVARTKQFHLVVKKLLRLL